MLMAEELNTYYGLSHILFDLSLEVNAEEIVCVLGRNGVGEDDAPSNYNGADASAHRHYQVQG